jgi:hypothetical protein
MADRYPNRPFPADDFGRGGDQHGSAGGESDPLAELARLIGQTDPFGATTGRPANPPPQRAAVPRDNYQPAQPPQPQYQPPPAQQYQPQQAQYEDPYGDEEVQPPPGPPSWMQRANLSREAAARRAPPPAELPYDEPEDEQPNAVHPLHRYAAQSPVPHDAYHQQAYDEGEEQGDPSRYDDALYGQLETGAHDFQREPAYPDDPYAYQDGYEDEPEHAPKRRGGLVTVAAVLALAVIGTGAAFAYRTYVGSPRSGDPPIIKADNSPTKIMPAPTDASGKTADRMPTGDGTEKLVPREETPVDVNSRAAGPRVVFPPLNQNANPPTAASVSPSAMPPSAAPGAAPTNGTMPNSEPRKIKTFAVHGDQPDPSAAPVTTAPAVPAAPPVAAKPARQAAPSRSQTQAANAPLSLSPDSAQAALPPAPEPPRTRMAATTPTQTAPPASDAAPAAEGRFLVQISSQTTEAEAQASFRSLQKKYPDQLGSQSPIIRKHDLGDKGVRYRTMVGPFASRDEAARFCTGYKAAGGQCFIP